MFSSLPLLADFGTVVTINIAVALLSALVVVPPLVKEADRLGLLAMGPAGTHEHSRRRRAVTGWVGAAVIAAIGLTVTVVSVRDHKATAACDQGRGEHRGTGHDSAPDHDHSSTDDDDRCPPARPCRRVRPFRPRSRCRPAHRNDRSDSSPGCSTTRSPVSESSPGVARCAADNLIATTSEADLLAKGIAAVPRPAEVNALLDTAAKQCGVTQAQLDAAAAAG